MATTKKSPKRRPRKGVLNNDPRNTLTQTIIDEACEYAALGNFRRTIYQGLGIPRGTWESWLVRGRRDIEDFTSGKIKNLGMKGKFVIALERAESEAVTSIHKNIMESEDPALQLKFLKLRHPKMYSGISNSYVDDETGEEVETSAGDLLAQKLASFLSKDS